jgi:hypothetical protein
MSSQQKDIESSDEEHDFILEKKETVVTSNEEIPNEEILNEEQSQKHVIKNATVFNTVELEESSDSEYEEIIIRKKIKKKGRKNRKNRKKKEKKLENDDNVKLRDFVNELEHVNMFNFQVEPIGQ